MTRLTCGLVASLVAILALTATARAQVTPTNLVVDPAGWNMVGGPPGTSYAGALAVFAYNGAYTAVSTTVSDPCAGLWADYSVDTSVTLPANTAASQACPLHAGWNLVNNPFPAPATLPVDFTGWHWNRAYDSYDLISTIPAGSSLWIYSDIDQTITLSNSSVVRPPATVEIDNLPAAPVTLHVGDDLRLLLPSAIPHQATVADTNVLVLDSAGETGPLSCVGTGCALSLVNQFWLWRAVSPGTTTITVVALCTLGNMPCAYQNNTLTVTVIP